jgi:hypothetical protein
MAPWLGRRCLFILIVLTFLSLSQTAASCRIGTREE